MPESDLRALCRSIARRDDQRRFHHRRPSGRRARRRRTDAGPALCLRHARDRIIWDVGIRPIRIRSSPGGASASGTLRQGGGLSGFTAASKANTTPFGAAHSSTSISAGGSDGGGARSVAWRQPRRAVIGDGAMSAGMAYEAMKMPARCIRPYRHPHETICRSRRRPGPWSAYLRASSRARPIARSASGQAARQCGYPNLLRQGAPDRRI